MDTLLYSCSKITNSKKNDSLVTTPSSLLFVLAAELSCPSHEETYAPGKASPKKGFVPDVAGPFTAIGCGTENDIPR